MDGWMDGGEETHPLEPFLHPHPGVLASISAILTRHGVFYAPYSAHGILWKPCVCTVPVPSSVFPPLLRPS